MVYNVLKQFIKRGKPCLVDINWKEYLSQLYPDVGGSCLCKNEIASKEKRVNLEIIIPVYNTEKYVAECIESVLNQKTHFSYRVIIINDGSTDNSSQVIEKYRNDNHVQIVHQENRGISASRNRALKCIGGDYVTFLDSDDRLSENAVEKLLCKAYEGDYDIVGCGYLLFEDKRVLSKNVPETQQLYGYPWGKVYKASLWENVKFPEKYWFEDTVCCMIIHEIANKITSIPETHYYYRLNRKGFTSSSVHNPKVIDTLWVTLRLLKDRENMGLPFDSNFQDILVNQFKVNAWRIYPLDDERANVSNYLASKELYLRYCKNCHCNNKLNRLLEEAILEDNYRLFILACILL